MRVVLVAPQSIRPVTQNLLLEPPSGLLTLAASIRRMADPVIVDSQLHHLTVEETARTVLDLRPDVVGISVNFVSLLRNAESIAQKVRQALNEVPIVFGGNYATFFSDDLIRNDWLDAIILNEADLSFPEFLARYERTGRIQPVSGSVVKADGGLQRIEFTDYVKDLDGLPFAAYDLLEGRAQYLTSLISSRGCPYNCMYCSTKAMWGAWRGRSAENILKQIDELMPTLPLPRINFCDDLFTVNRKRVQELCAGMKERGVPVSWGVNARAETMDNEMPAMLGEAGCRNIFFGFESGSDRMLRKLGRYYTSADIERIVDNCIASRIIPHASFMIGMPWETPEDAAETIALIERLNTPYILMNLFTPLAGTPVFRNPGEYGVTLFDGVDGQEGQIDNGVVFHRTESMSAEEIKDLWIEGTGVVVSRGREREAYEAFMKESVC
jgi:anaerobic magnesium-protoporphyrin IX monomethyl ester cyclase